MYLVFNIWSGQETLRFADMVSKAEEVTLLGRNEELFFEQKEDVLYIHGLPEDPGEPLFPVIKIRFNEKPRTNEWGASRQWQGDPMRIARWGRGEK